MKAGQDMPLAFQFVNRREYFRHDCNLPARLIGPNGDCAVSIRNISGGGAMIRADALSAQTLTGNGFRVQIETIGGFGISRRWRKNDDFGVSFNISDREKAALGAKLAQRFSGAGRRSLLSFPWL